MTDVSWVAIVLISLIWFPAVVLMWRYIDGMEEMSGQNLRAMDRERRDHQEWIMRLIEKRDSDNVSETERRHLIHANERLKADTSVETEAVKNKKKPDPAAVLSDYCTPEEYLSSTS